MAYGEPVQKTPRCAGINLVVFYLFVVNLVAYLLFPTRMAGLGVHFISSLHGSGFADIDFTDRRTIQDYSYLGFMILPALATPLNCVLVGLLILRQCLNLMLRAAVQSHLFEVEPPRVLGLLFISLVVFGVLTFGAPDYVVIDPSPTPRPPLALLAFGLSMMSPSVLGVSLTCVLQPRFINRKSRSWASRKENQL
ncbi:MAG: hypothetical protein AAGF27_02915 [Pseudomonadota bacterium]